MDASKVRLPLGGVKQINRHSAVRDSSLQVSMARIWLNPALIVFLELAGSTRTQTA